jgi:hypothetical protein
MKPYLFQRGETIGIALDAIEGDVATVSAISAVMKLVPPGRNTVPADTPVAATFSVTPRAAAGGIAAGWNLIVSDSASAGLAPGTYHADARLTVGGGVIVTDPITIQIKQSVTP